MGISRLVDLGDGSATQYVITLEAFNFLYIVAYYRRKRCEDMTQRLEEAPLLRLEEFSFYKRFRRKPPPATVETEVASDTSTP